jgi:hypothetical protein
MADSHPGSSQDREKSSEEIGKAEAAAGKLR